MSNKIILGIDLGTTTSAAHILKNNKIIAMKEGGGKTLIDSIVGIDPKSKKISVGDLSSSRGDDQNFVRWIKRLMGKNTTVSMGNEEYSPDQISSEILKYIKLYSEEQVGENIDEVVITIPANFGDNERAATKKAGELAGFKSIKLISEPTAAALAYVQENQKDDFEMVLIYDLGGGTFDVAVGEFKGDTLNVLGNSGNPNLGGADFDQALFEYVNKDFKKEYGIDLSKDKGAKFDILIECERIKKELSFKDEVTLSMPRIASDKDGKPLNIKITITKEIFESLISKKIDETKTAIDKALNLAKKADPAFSGKPEDIGTILLVGGSTRIPYVQELVKEHMGKDARKDIDPDLAVSIGAAYYGGIHSGETDAIILNRSAISYGTEVVSVVNGMQIGGIYSEIVPENAEYGREYKDVFFPLHDEQTGVDAKIYSKPNLEKSPVINDNFTFIGEFQITGIPENGQATKEKIEVTYTINDNGILEAKAEILSTNEMTETHEFGINFTQPSNPSSSDEILENRDIEESINWQDSSILNGEFKTTITLAEKQLKKESNSKLNTLLTNLKTALINEDKDTVEELDEEINDFLFDLEND